MRTPVLGALLVVLVAPLAAHAEEKKLYLSISAQGGGLLTYSNYTSRNEYGPAFLLNAYVTTAYRASPLLAVGGTVGLLAVPIGARIRAYTDQRPSDTTLGVGAGFFGGGSLSLFLQERVVLENAFGFAILGSPGVYGGLGPALNETLAFRFKGEGSWKYGFDLRLLAVVPSIGIGSSRNFGLMMALTAGFSIALQ